MNNFKITKRDNSKVSFKSLSEAIYHYENDRNEIGESPYYSELEYSDLPENMEWTWNAEMSLHVIEVNSVVYQLGFCMSKFYFISYLAKWIIDGQTSHPNVLDKFTGEKLQYLACNGLCGDREFIHSFAWETVYKPIGITEEQYLSVHLFSPYNLFKALSVNKIKFKLLYSDALYQIPNLEYLD